MNWFEANKPVWQDAEEGEGGQDEEDRPHHGQPPARQHGHCMACAEHGGPHQDVQHSVHHAVGNNVLKAWRAG